MGFSVTQSEEETLTKEEEMLLSPRSPILQEINPTASSEPELDETTLQMLKTLEEKLVELVTTGKLLNL